ncbi:hypothetical protein BS47DRAFT_602856 [Hydnum rufescens UP504]|uniref:Uncharacterized protein n=1 Tax=Hydnum rufescens UP504 TaxID=1448309 RepID=A0A9P6B2Z4_9AGAM|nr:hypothetical protein BS47DRAFT_602856 [Hydnum rufescens UP504]
MMEGMSFHIEILFDAWVARIQRTIAATRPQAMGDHILLTESTILIYISRIRVPVLTPTHVVQQRMLTVSESTLCSWISFKLPLHSGTIWDAVASLNPNAGYFRRNSQRVKPHPVLYTRKV